MVNPPAVISDTRRAMRRAAPCNKSALGGKLEASRHSTRGPTTAPPCPDRSRRMSLRVITMLERPSEFETVQRVHCIGAGPRRQGHVGQRRVLIRGGDHARAIHHEEIPDVVRLIVPVENRGR